MTSRFGKRNRSSSKLDHGAYSPNPGEQSRKIKDLEKALEEKDKTIAELQERVKELGSELERRKQFTDVLTSERNALRQKNASLVGKLAELSRKQSVSSFTTLPSPPELPKRYPAISTRPDLPPTPASPETPFEDADQEPGATSRFNFGLPASPRQPNGHIGQSLPPQSNHVHTTTKEEDSETDYSDMEDDLEAVSPVTTTTTNSTVSQSINDDRDKSDFVNSGQVRESEVESVLAAVQDNAKKMNFITTNSDRKVSPRLSPKQRREEERVVAAGSSREEESLRAKGMVDNTSLEETREKGNVRLQKRPSVETLTAQFERAASSSTPSIPTSSLKWPRSQNHQGSPHSPSTLSDISPSELIFSEKTTVVKPRSSSLRGNSSSDTTPLSTSHNRTPSVHSAGSGASPEPPKRYNSGSEGIASRIASLFSGNRNNSKDKGSPPPPATSSDEARNTTTMMNGNVEEQNQNGSAAQSPEIPLTNEVPLANETPLATETPLTNEMPLTNEIPATDDSTPKRAICTESPSIMKKFKQDSVASNMGSDLISSGDYSTTDIDSSFDLTSPPTSPASSLGASSLASTSTSISSPSRRLEGIEARNAVLSRKRFERKSPRVRRVRVERGGGEEEEDGDTLGDLPPMNSLQKMRERTKTVSLSQGVSSRTTTELGRQKRTKKEIREKQFALKRHHSLTDLRLIGGMFALKELELISPDFESKIRDKITKSVGEKYGGLEKATQAAIKIQQSWRQFKLRSRFQKIKQQNKSQLQQQLRQRAQTMRNPRRRPSIMKKRGKRAYHREASVAAIPSTEQQKAGKSSGLTRGAESKVKIERRLTEERDETEGERKKVIEIVEVSVDTTLEGGNTNAIQPPKFQLNDSSVVPEPPGPTTTTTAPAAVVQVQIDSSSPTPSNTSDSPDGLTASFTAGDLRSSPRPLSVFSTGSSVSPSGSYQEGLVVQSLPISSVTLPRLRPRPHDQDSLERDRALSVGSAMNRKRAIGINHFNRKPTKGIQYLVESRVLDDDPKSVADFLTDDKNKLCKQKIGEFVGEINSDFNMAVLGCLLEQMDMSGKPIDTALRELQQLFRMPGEAQKIDKIMEIFALEYFKHNKEIGSVRSEDAAYILSFAIMMLHTALHNPSVKHKTTKREWVSMNRGCNDGENFRESFLLDIYDRIQSTEFVCGKDHTQEVAEIEKQIIAAANLPKLTTSQRRLVLKRNVNEVLDLSRGPNFRQRHKRTLFIFNDLVVVCKQRRHEQYQCRNFFPLLHVLPVKFETEHYRNGVQLLSAIERKVLLQCTCDSLGERATLLEKLEETLKELEEMENERIEELGTSLSAKPSQDVHIGGSVRHSSTSKSRGQSMADLQVSSSLGKLASSSLTDLREQSYEEDSQVRPSSYVHVRNNRASGDSGFDSPQQDADTPISTPTPSPTEQNHIDATDSQTPSPSPSPSPALLPPSSPQNTLTTPAHSSAAITHSRSHDGLRTLTVYPSTPERSPSAELVRSSPASSPVPSPSHKRSGKKEKKARSHYVNISFFRSKKESKSSSGGSSPGASPIHNRKRRASDSSHAVHGIVRETSPSNVHTPLAQSLNLNANFGTGNLSDNEGHP